MEREIEVYSSKTELVSAVAKKIIGIISSAIQENGLCTVALAGGNTPREVYSLLAEDPYKSRINWNKVELFWGDERTVTPDHPGSNFRMVKETLLARIDVPQENVHRMRGEIDPTEAAAEYREILKREFETITPCFDLVLLGVGDDGHTASIFPRTNAIEENHESVVAVFVPKFSTWRITLTLPVLNAAKNVMFIISGGSKSEIAKRVINGEQTTKELPVTLVRPKNGTLHWMLDSEAAATSNVEN